MVEGRVYDLCLEILEGGYDEGGKIDVVELVESH